MDRQQLRLFETGRDGLPAAIRPGNPDAHDRTGSHSEENLVRIASFMPAGAVGELAEVPADTAGSVETEEPELTPEEEARVDRLAETYHSYGDAYRRVIADRHNSRAA